MTLVRQVGLPLAVLLGVLGVGLALALVPAPGLVVLGLFATGAGWAWSRTGQGWPSWMWPRTVVVPFAVLASSGWLAADAPGAVLTAGVVTCAAAAWCRRAPEDETGMRSYRISAPPLPAAAPDHPATVPAGCRDLDGWTDAELCRVWRQTYAQVLAAAGPVTLGALVECRSAVLVELERRNPAGFTAWIDSGARAAGNPEPYLQH